MKLLRIQRAFSIVELAIVIAVIGILAATTLVAYPLVQNNAKDAKIKEGATKIAQAIELWSARTNETPETVEAGYGSVGSVTVDANGSARCDNAAGTGWIYSGWDSNYPCTIVDILEKMKFLPDGYIDTIPFNPKTNRVKDVYYLSNCGLKPNYYALLYSLSNPSADDTAEYNRVVSQCGVTGNVTPSFKSQYQLGGATFLQVAE